MRYANWCASLLAIALLVVMSVGSAQAQATRTWVSGVGDDANPCSRTAPCKTFAGAISKTAPGGEINCLDPGGFGAVTITKSIIISCETGTAGVLVSGTNGINISAASTDVVYLKGLDFEGLGTSLSGINFITGAALHVEKCLIRGFTTNGITFAPTTAASNVATLVIQDSTIADNPGGGVKSAPGAGISSVVTITNTHMDRNTFGLRVEDRTSAAVIRSTAASNVNNGLLAVSTSVASKINVIDSLAMGNLGNAGVSVSGALAVINLFNSATVSNLNGISISGGTVRGTTPNTVLNAGNTNVSSPNGSSTLQ